MRRKESSEACTTYYGLTADTETISQSPNFFHSKVNINLKTVNILNKKLFMCKMNRS